MSDLDQMLELLERWDPESGADLPDEVALAMDEHPALRAAFDARFSPADADAEAVPAGLADRVLPEGTSSRAAEKGVSRSWGRSAMLQAALALLGVGVVGVAGVAGVAFVRPSPMMMVEAVPSAEFERTSAVSSEARNRGRVMRELDHGGMSRREREALSALGYLEPANPDAIAAPERSSNRWRDRRGDMNQQLELLGYASGDDENGEVGVELPTGAVGTFTDHGVAGFVATSNDALSTFSVDVDTASYTVSRRTLRSGHLPPHAAVRVEEFVNFVDYDYPQPAPGEPFSVHVEAAPSPWTSDTHVLRVGVQGRRVAFDQRKPVHLTFLVDTSGSMQSSDKLRLVKLSLSMLVEELRDGDTVAIVAYAGAAGVVLEPTPMSRKEDVLEALGRLIAGGSTAMGQGVDLAYDLALQTAEPGGVNRVIIASDGDANVGVTDPTALTKMIAGYADRGITLTTLGFGTGNYRDHRMEQLANDGDGNYFYIDGVEEARRIFVDELTSTLQVIARDVKLQVAFDPESVLQYRLIGYENRDIADRDFRNDAVDAGEVGAGHQVTALYEVQLASDPRGLLGTVSVRSKAPGPDAPSVEQSWPIPRHAVRPSVREASADYAVAVATATFAEKLRGSPHVFAVSWQQIVGVVQWARRVEHPEDLELVELIQRAASLSDER